VGWQATCFGESLGKLMGYLVVRGNVVDSMAHLGIDLESCSVNVGCLVDIGTGLHEVGTSQCAVAMGTPFPRVRAVQYSTIVGAVNPLPFPRSSSFGTFALAFFPLEGNPLPLAGVGARPIMRLETVYWRASFGESVSKLYHGLFLP
jgi:hypothetical protein